MYTGEVHRARRYVVSSEGVICRTLSWSVCDIGDYTGSEPSVCRSEVCMISNVRSVISDGYKSPSSWSEMKEYPLQRFLHTCTNLSVSLTANAKSLQKTKFEHPTPTRKNPSYKHTPLRKYSPHLHVTLDSSKLQQCLTEQWSNEQRTYDNCPIKRTVSLVVGVPINHLLHPELVNRGVRVRPRERYRDPTWLKIRRG